MKNALTPQGELRLLLGRSVKDSDWHLFSQSALRPGSALGDSALRALGGVRLAAFDDLNAPFPVFGDAVLLRGDFAGAGGAEGTQETGEWGEFCGRINWDCAGERAAPVGLGFWEWLWILGLAGRRFSFVPGRGRGGWRVDDLGMSGFGNPYSALAGDGMVAGVAGDGFRLAAFWRGPRGARRVRGALAEFSPLPSSSLPAGVGLWFQVGGVEELDGLLDTSGAGIFGDLRARTAFCRREVFRGVHGGLALSRRGIRGPDCGGGRRRLVCAGGGFVERLLRAGLGAGRCAVFPGTAWDFAFISRCGRPRDLGCAFRRVGRAMGI